MSDQPKVTLQQWRSRVNAGRIASSNGAQPGDIAVPAVDGTNGASHGKSDAKTSGNPLHPDLTEELGRLRETVSVLKRQIYGNSTGESGIVSHLQDIENSTIALEARLTTLEGHFGALVIKFAELLDLLGVDEEVEDAKAQ